MPAIIPLTIAQMQASHAGQPARINITDTAQPVAKVPSTDRSARFRILKEIYTPRAMIPQIIPWAIPPGRRPIRFANVIALTKLVRIIINLCYSIAT